MLPQPVDTPDGLWTALAPQPTNPNPFWSGVQAHVRQRAWDELATRLEPWTRVINRGGAAFLQLGSREDRSRAAALLAAMVAWARCLVVAHRGSRTEPSELTALFRVAHESLAQVLGLTEPKPTIEPSDSLANLVQQVEDGRFDTLAVDLDPFRSSVPLHSIELPVLLAMGTVGEVGLLQLELRSSPSPRAYWFPDLAKLGFRLFDRDFQTSQQLAWDLVKSEFAAGSHVRWSLLIPSVEPIRGPSAGVAFAVGLLGLARRLMLAGGGVTGALGPDGMVRPVGGLVAKAGALSSLGLGRFLIARGDQAAQIVRALCPGVSVHEIDTIHDAIPLLTGEVDAIEMYLRGMQFQWHQDSWSGEPLPTELVVPRVSGPGQPHPRPWTEIRQKFPTVALFGGIGAGKSFLLRTEAHRLAQEALDSLNQSGTSSRAWILPLLLQAPQLVEHVHQPTQVAFRLLALTRTPGLEPWSEPVQTCIAQAIQEGRVHLLVDGWDELPDDTISQVMKWLRSASVSRLRIATRSLGATGAIELCGGRRLELAAWTKDEQSRVMQARLDPESYQRLHHSLDQSPQLREMASNPMLLVWLGRVLQHRPSLPHSRGELIVSLLDGILGVWPVARGQGLVRELTDREQIQLSEHRDQVARFVWHLVQDRPKQVSFGWKSIQTALSRAGLSAELFAMLSRTQGLFVTGDGPVTVYRFFHRSCRDFLLAWELGRRSDWLEVVHQHLYDPDWFDVLSLLGIVLNRQDSEDRPDEPGRVRQLLDQLHRVESDDALGRPLILAAALVSELSEPAVQNRLAESLLSLYLSPDCPVPRSILAGVLAGLGAPVASRLARAIRDQPELRVDVWEVLARRQSTTPSAAELADSIQVRSLIQSLGSPGRDMIIEFSFDPDPDLAAFGFSCWTTGPVPAPIVTRALSLLASSAAAAHRRAAAEVLSLDSSRETLQVLLTSTQDPDETVARRVLAVLALRFQMMPNLVAELIRTLSTTHPQILEAIRLATTDRPAPTDWIQALLSSAKPEAQWLGYQLVEKLDAIPESILTQLRDLAPQDRSARAALACHDREYAHSLQSRLLAELTPTQLQSLVERHIYARDEVREVMLSRLTTDPAERVRDLVIALRALGLGDRQNLEWTLLNRIEPATGSDRDDLLDAAWTLQQSDGILLPDLQAILAPTSGSASGSRVLRKSEPEPPSESSNVPSFSVESLSRVELLDRWETAMGSRLDLVAAVWRQSARLPVPLADLPPSVRQLVESIGNHVK